MQPGGARFSSTSCNNRGITRIIIKTRILFNDWRHVNSRRSLYIEFPVKLGINHTINNKFIHEITDDLTKYGIEFPGIIA